MGLQGCRRRSLWLLMVLSLCFALLGGRLFYLQIWRSKMLAGRAVQQRFQCVSFSDGRGDIQDRHGLSLLDSRSRPGLLAFPAHYRGREEEIIGSLSSLEGIERIAAPPHEALPFWISTALDEEQAARLALYPGFVAAESRERYGPGALASHLVGYINESEGRGVSGIELAFDQTLSAGGARAVGALVDGRGRLITGLGYREREAQPLSKNVILSLDRELQREVERIMDRRIGSGAVVVLDPASGDILAMASRPGFHPSTLSAYLDKNNEALLKHALCAYQPGSVFKIVVAAAALEEGLTGLFQTFHCSGGITVEGRNFPCSNLHPRQKLTLAEAFAHSCNSVFIELALELGPDKLAEYARRFGLGEGCGLPLAEQAGYLPGPAVLAAPQAVANTALGQGDVMVTPLQAAVLVATVANGGYRPRPRLVLALTEEQRGETARFWSSRGERVLSPGTVNKLKFMLHEVVARGTAQATGRTALPAAAKTGTAESGRRHRGRERTNHWIAGFYPLEKARVAVAVFADDLREGTVQQVFGEIIARVEKMPEGPSP